MAHPSPDDTLALPKETLVSVMGYAVNNMYESAFERVQEDEHVKISALSTTSVTQLKDAFASEIINAFNQKRPTILGRRLVGHLWKSAVEETIRKREILKLNFTPDDALSGDPINEMFKSVAPIITGLEFTGWGEGEFPTVSGIISTYNLNINNITDIRIEPNVTPILFDFLEAFPNITKISIVGNLGPWDRAPIRLHELFTKDLTKLRYLNLSGNNLTSYALSFTTGYLPKGPMINLEELHLANNNITVMSMGSFHYLIRMVKKDHLDGPLPSLKVLNLRSNRWPTSDSHVEQGIERMFTLFPKLTTVNVEDCALDENKLTEIAKRTHKIIRF